MRSLLFRSHDAFYKSPFSRMRMQITLTWKSQGEVMPPHDRSWIYVGESQSLEYNTEQSSLVIEQFVVPWEKHVGKSIGCVQIWLMEIVCPTVATQ